MYVDVEMEALVRRVVPDEERKTWEGASDDQIVRVERIAQRPLPGFYRWFLGTMGAAFPHPQYGHERQDFRVETVLEAYRQGLVAPDLRLLLIGRIPDAVMPELVFYDLDASCRDDAMVVTSPESGFPMRRGFETLREKLAWGMMRKRLVTGCAQRCEGNFADSGGAALSKLTPILRGLGFTSPITTGSYCGLYEHDAVIMTCIDLIEDSQGDVVFQLGGPDAVALRRLLGEIAVKSSLEVRSIRWRPPLPE